MKYLKLSVEVFSTSCRKQTDPYCIQGGWDSVLTIFLLLPICWQNCFMHVVSCLLTVKGSVPLILHANFSKFKWVTITVSRQKTGNKDKSLNMSVLETLSPFHMHVLTYIIPSLNLLLVGLAFFSFHHRKHKRQTVSF